MGPLLIYCMPRICIEREEDVFLLDPAEVHSLPASFVTEGRLSRSTIRPTQHLIYYLRFCLRLGSVNAIGSSLMNCIKGVDHFDVL